MKAADFILLKDKDLKKQTNLFSIWNFFLAITVGCIKSNYQQFSAPSKKVITNLLVASVTSFHL